MEKRILNEINEMKYMLSYKKGEVLSEQIKNDEITEADYTSSPFILNATPDGDIKVVNSTTKQVYIYSISAYGVPVDVKDFPEGKSIKVSIPLKGVQTYDLPTGSQSANTIKQNVGKEKITIDLNGVSVTLKCQSGCVKPGNTKTTTDKVKDSISDVSKGAINLTKSFFN